ncbi:MAG TPA: FecR family protein [Terriglobia bacterium]|nr:FecR family protein [Terriglobia bacterium]
MKVRLWVLITVLLLAGTNALRGADDDDEDARWLGVLWTKGAVLVGDAKATSGTTVLPRDVITTSEGASAWVRYRSPASAILLADTEVVLFASDPAPSLLLRRGTVVVDEGVADPAQVTIPGGFVLVQGAPQAEAECEIAAIDNATTVSVRRGLAEIHGQGAPVILRPGQSARVDAGPQGGQPDAGRINRAIPKGKIVRELQELPLKQNDPVKLNDLVQTLDTGRAQIKLLDGSTLNVGIRSQMRILKHDPENQVTVIELVTGKVRADAQKVTKPDGKFEMHAGSAVIGTVDTSYVVEIDDKKTRVCGVKGTTVVKSSNPAIKGEVILHRKQCTVVVFGAPPTSPVFAPAQMASMLNQTVVQTAGGIGGLSTGAVAGIAAGGAAAAAVTGVVLATTGTTSPTTP